MKNRIKWGGSRKGAGRKKGSSQEERVMLKVFILPESKVFIKNMVPYKGSMGKVIDKMIKEYED